MTTELTAARPRILFVDDDAALRARVAEALSDEYAIETAGTGTEALRAVLRAEPALIVTDIVLPGRDGVELLKTLRTRPSTRGIPVLLVSGHARDSRRIEALQEGADGYLAKPYSEPELRAVIGAMLKSARRRSEAALQAVERVSADLRQTLETAGVGLNRCTRDLRYVWSNAAYAQLAGLTVEQIVGSTVDRVLGSETFARVRPYIERVLAGERVEYEHERPIAGGPSCWFGVIYTPTIDADGEVTGWVASVTDISKRRRAEETLREQARTLERLGQMSEALIGAQLDTGRVVQIVTDTATELLGAAYGAFFPEPGNESGEPRALCTLDSAAREAFAAAPPAHLARIFGPAGTAPDAPRSADPASDARGDGAIMRSRLSATVRTAAGEALGELRLVHPEPAAFDARGERLLLAVAAQAAVAFENARLHHAVREELARRARVEQALNEADRHKDEFLAMLAHELRNPMAPISTASELLARAAGDDERSRFASEAIKRQITQLTRLVDDLLDVSRITRGRIELKFGVVELARVIGQAVETVEPQLREKEQRIAVATAQPQSLWVRGDYARLVQCVVNVLSNAIKYSDPHGRIRLDARPEGDGALIEITDSGAGISPELLPRVFDLFVQGDRSLDRNQGGLGIGLSVVKRLIEMHGGEVTARSQGRGRGSTFRIRLPLVARPGSPEPAGARVSPGRRRVIIVDDNHDAANTLAALLELEGHETRVAYGSRQALELLERFVPDVAILDIGLPEMDGYALARRLRALPRVCDAKLIALTGYGQAQERRRALEAGFDEHLVKPVEVEVLQRALMSGKSSG